MKGKGKERKGEEERKGIVSPSSATNADQPQFQNPKTATD